MNTVLIISLASPITLPEARPAAKQTLSRNMIPRKPFSSKDCWNCESHCTCLPGARAAPRAALKAAGSNGLSLEHPGSDWNIWRNINLQHQYYLFWFRLILHSQFIPTNCILQIFHSLSNSPCVNIVWSFNPMLKFTPYLMLRTYGF